MPTTIFPQLVSQFAPDRAAPETGTVQGSSSPLDDNVLPTLSPRGRQANLPEVLIAPYVRMVYAVEHRRLFGCLPAWCTP